MSARITSFYVKRNMEARDVVVNLNIKACCFYEKLTGESFLTISTPEEILQFLYATVTVNNPGLQMKFETFLEMLKNKKFATHLFESYYLQTDILGQLSKITTDEEKEGALMTITDIANALIIKYGVDAHYVMYEMDLWELGKMFSMIDENVKQDLLEKRMWTFLEVAPHIDTKKIKTPEKFLPFDWEKQDKKEKRVKDLAKETERAKSILGMKIEI